MRREINFNNLIYNFKGWSPSISFTEFGGPTYTYNQLKNGDEALRQVEDQKKFRLELNEIGRGSKNPAAAADAGIYKKS